MESFAIKNQQKMRRGYTTGSCAAGASAAAVLLLLTQKMPAILALPTPKGITLQLEPEKVDATSEYAICAIRKDSGDDPDVTNGIRIFARVSKTKEGITIEGGSGVGTVTLPGLACQVGKAAINPVPRKQIYDAVQKAMQSCQYTGGIYVVISAENGEQIAQKTMNPHLGIRGGISILGTSGIVEPMSEQALVDTIKVELDSRVARNDKNVLACPGNYGQDFAHEALNIDLHKAVITSNYIGETLDYMVFREFESMLLIGHAGKLVKLAAGIMQTHSAYADGRQEIFAAHAAMHGAPKKIIVRIMNSVTVDACMDILDEVHLTQTVMESIGKKIYQHVQRRVHGKMKTEFIVFTNMRGELWRSQNATELLQRFQEKSI